METRRKVVSKKKDVATGHERRNRKQKPQQATRRSRNRNDAAADEKIVVASANTRNGKQQSVQAGRSLAIIKAEKITASLDNEQLAIRVVDGFVTLRPKLEEWLPLAIELRSRFEKLRREKKGGTILGCRTWEQFCKEKLGYTDGHVRSLMRGANPAAKYSNKTLRGTQKRVPSRALGAGEALTDDEYAEKGVRAVNEALRDLESDPSRFARVALKIAAQLRKDFETDNDDDADWGDEGTED